MPACQPLRRPARHRVCARAYNAVDMQKKVSMMAAMVLEGGLPPWVPTCCIPKVAAPVATALPDLGPGSVEMVAPEASLRGVVVYAHGLSDGPPSIAQVLETLATRGFIVVAPSFGDDDSNGIDPLLEGGFQNLPAQHVRRIERMEAAITFARTQFGTRLPLSLMGYSTGTDTIRQMPIAAPRIYIAGPGWQDKISGQQIASQTPGGPALLLFAAPDAEMVRFGFDADYATQVALGSTDGAVQVKPSEGSDWDAFRAKFLQQLPPLALGTKAAHLRVELPGFAHSSFKHPPFAASENRAWSVLLCGTNPWDLPCLGGGAAGPSPQVKQERADAVATIVADWMLAAVGS